MGSLDLKLLQEPFNNLSNPVAKSAGKTLQDVWDLVFGGFGVFVEKKRMKREKDLEDFKKCLTEHVAEIPEDYIKEPNLSVIGPALESSKYYYEEPVLREMFAKLVSSSMDSRKNLEVHPCFVEIIKQLSPFDAEILLLFATTNTLPIARIEEFKDKSETSFSNIIPDVFLSDKYPNIEENQLAFSSLERASLIRIEYDHWFVDDERYEDIRRISKISTENKRIGWEKYKLGQGCAVITPLGKAFIDVCL